MRYIEIRYNLEVLVIVKKQYSGPLTEVVYYILLALFEPRHGYGIMQFVKELTSNRVELGPGTLYGAISTLLDKEWIELVNKSTNARKKEYIITIYGREIIRNELKRLNELVNHGNLIYGEV